ncbi:MAG: hypothetical protein NT011_12615 [Kiritimatiellaeota bacterium]|nr:hypothetical protein [Kiritimatiellota bacterium]
MAGKFAANIGARREALDMYPRERRKPTDAAKLPARFERNAWHGMPHQPNLAQNNFPSTISH